jgi:hypothetical protein
MERKSPIERHTTIHTMPIDIPSIRKRNNQVNVNGRDSMGESDSDGDDDDDDRIITDKDLSDDYYHDHDDDDYDDDTYQAKHVSVDDWINTTIKRAKGYLFLSLVLVGIAISIFFIIMTIQIFVSKYEDALIDYNKHQSTLNVCTQHGLTDPALFRECKHARKMTQKNILLPAVGECMVEIWKKLEQGLVHLLLSPVLWVILASMAFVMIFYTFKPGRNQFSSLPLFPHHSPSSSQTHPHHHPGESPFLYFPQPNNDFAENAHMYFKKPQNSNVNNMREYVY